MLSDAKRPQQVKSRAVSARNKSWGDAQKLEAVKAYLLLGNVALVSATLKIPEQTIYSWKHSEWWHDIVSEIRKEDRLVLSQKLKKIAEKSWDVVSDRLDNGDWVLNQKTGELVRKPVALRDAAKVATDAANLQLGMDKDEQFTVAHDQIDEKLNKLAQAFADLAKGKLNKEDAEDIEYVEEIDGADDEGGSDNAIHEERQEGL